MAASTLNRAVPHVGEVQRVYVMPLKQYNLSIDSDCHRKFLALLAAHDAASFRVAASDLSLLREGRVSLPRLRVSSYDAEAPIMLLWPRGRVQLQLLLHAWNLRPSSAHALDGRRPRGLPRRRVRIYS